MTPRPVSRRTLLAAAGGAPDGPAGLAAAFPLAAVTLLDSAFRGNQARNTRYLLFVDPDRLLRTLRLNYGLRPAARPCGGWEAPESEVRGHTTGHLMSALALTYANTGNEAAAEKGRYLVDQLGRCQARARSAGFHEGYLSAFPESFFDLLEAGQPVWAPYYMIHKYLAGLIDQHELAGNARALEVAARLGDWVCWRTSRLPYDHMQQILENEHGGIAEALANLHRITGERRYLRAAERFYHARILDPLAAGQDQLAGLHANTTVPKIVACMRMHEETGDHRYRDIAENFWRIVTGHHSYIIGGSEHWQEPGVIAGQLSNSTCENYVSYNMLKLTRLLHFHQPGRTDLLDHYERILFNQMLGEQDPGSPHGFNEYYYGLSPDAFKQQPLNYFPRAGLDAYSHRLRQLHLRPRDRDGDPGEVRRHHLFARRGRPVRQPVHPVRGDLGGQRNHLPPGHRVPRPARDTARRGVRGGGDDGAGAHPGLDAASLKLTNTQPLTAQATADGQPVMLIPTARTHHQHYNVYWRT